MNILPQPAGGRRDSPFASRSRRRRAACIRGNPKPAVRGGNPP
ncbi:hypothetical protein HMPREF0043_02072 [Actinobaculum sp. oral taxon 183 str. F0552]|nr:hypothetical protein HMPREF0043_02072 [Actinobaculum sp. oral taxon 183 str. F0552]